MAFGMWHLHMEEIYLTTTSLPLNLQLRAGKFKSDIGRHNPTHLHQWKFVLHPLANQFLFGSEGLSLPGAELSVLLPLPWYVEIKGALQHPTVRVIPVPGKEAGISRRSGYALVVFGQPALAQRRALAAARRAFLTVTSAPLT